MHLDLPVLGLADWHGIRTISTQAYIYIVILPEIQKHPDSKDHGANMGPTWGRQDTDGPHVGPMNFAIREPAMLTLGFLLLRYDI